MNTNEAITPEQARTLDGLLRERVERTPQALAYRDFNQHFANWRDYSWAQIDREVARWQAALERDGLKAGDLLLQSGQLAFVTGQLIAEAVDFVAVFGAGLVDALSYFEFGLGVLGRLAIVQRLQLSQLLVLALQHSIDIHQFAGNLGIGFV